MLNSCFLFCLAVLKQNKQQMERVSDKQVTDSGSRTDYCMHLLCVTVAPETSWVKTVMLCPADRVFKSCISEGISQPTGPQENPKEMEYRPIYTQTRKESDPHLPNRADLLTL